MSEKKRKREQEQGREGRPVKKVAPGGPPSTVKVTFLPDADEWCPVIASTPGLSVPADMTLTPYKRTITGNPGDSRGSARPNQDEWLLQGSANRRLDYVAREEQDDVVEGLYKHYIGVYDPQTGDLKVVKARKMVVRRVLRIEDAELEEVKSAKPTASALRQELGMAFGTRKAKQAIASLTENAISPRKPRATSSDGVPKKPSTHDPLAAAVLDFMAASTDNMPSRDTLQAAVDEAKPKPKANLEAKIPAEVYPLSTLVSSLEMGVFTVKEWQDAARAGKAVETTSRFVSRRLHALAIGDDVRKLKVLRYIYVLLEFYASLKGGWRGMKKMPQREELRARLKVPDSLIDSIRKRFSLQGELTKWHIDYLITHIGALSLIIDDFETDTYDLRDDLRLESAQMTQYFRELGCKVTSPTEAERAKAKLNKAEAAAHKIARLKLPLEFPKLRVMAAKRK